MLDTDRPLPRPENKRFQVLDATPMPIKVFETQDFEQRAPGTILQDFEALLGLMGDQGLPVTPAHLLALSCLETINRSLTHPLELRLKRAVQKSYPYINGLYLLLRASGLTLIDTQSRKPRLQLDPVVLASWSSLNGAERYFALLKAWWGRSREEILGERQTWGGDALTKIMGFIERFPQDGLLRFETPQAADRLRYYPGLYNLALMEGFGLLEIRAIPPAEGQGWRPEWIRMTDWGKALLGHYLHFVRQTLVSETDAVAPILGFEGFFEPLARFEQWSQIIRPAITGWHKELEIPESPFQPGPHQFKVSLGAGCWRRILIGGEDSLDELAITILSAFDFDADHLYRFSYRDRFGRTIEIDHSYLAGDSDNALVDETRIGDLPLSEGMRIDFLFDFGDQWEFGIVTERLNTEAAEEMPVVLETHGKAPAQYGH